MQDTLGEIFKMVKAKQERIIRCCRLGQRPLRDNELHDPFKLYQGYLDIVKPIDTETTIAEYIEKMNLMQEKMDDANKRSDATMAACEQYLQEEEEIKLKLANL